MTIKRLVFSGGGTKGFTYLGCHKALVELELLTDLESVTGTSIGAVMATLIALKYTPMELYDFVTTLEYTHLQSLDIWCFFENLGLDTGEKMSSFFLALIRHKLKDQPELSPDPTFRELYDYHSIELNIVATLLNRYESVYFNHQSHPDHSIALALRKSIAIPWAITPVIGSNNHPTQSIEPSTPDSPTLFWIDGAVTNNFPIEIYPDSEETLGFLLEDCRIWQPERPSLTIEANPESYSYHVVQASCSQLTKWKLKSFKKTQVVHLPIDQISSLSVDLSEAKKKELYDYGYQETKKYFENHDKT